MTAGALPVRTLGRTGLEVTRIGYGAMSLDPGRLGPVSPEQAERILHAVLDAGINFIDTSPDYGPSEESIGRAIASRRAEYVLASKAGCPVAVPESAGHVYNRANVTAAVEQSLRRMRTDYLDLVQFHGNPSPEALADGEAVEALRDLQRAGKVRYIGASSTLPALPGLIALGVFDAFQVPYSALQRDHEALLGDARRAGAGTVVRGATARGGPEKGWEVRRLPELPVEATRERWERARLEELLDGASPVEFMLRFALAHPDLDTAIVGTADPAHLRANIAALHRGPLPPDVLAEARRRLDAVEA